MKYLTLIAAVTLLHQHQRQSQDRHPRRAAGPLRRDHAGGHRAGDRLAAEVLGRSLDELPPGTRRLLDAIAGYVSRRCEAEGLDADLVRFTRRQLREALTFGDTQLKVHLARLADWELVIVHRLDRAGSATSWPGRARHRRHPVLPGPADPGAVAAAG